MEVRLRGRDPEFVVTAPVADAADALDAAHDGSAMDHEAEPDRAGGAGGTEAAPPDGDDGGTSWVRSASPNRSSCCT